MARKFIPRSSEEKFEVESLLLEEFAKATEEIKWEDTETYALQKTLEINK